MKDPIHHKNKVTSKVVRSTHEEVLFEEKLPAEPLSEKQIKKQKKARIRKEKAAAPHIPLSAEEKNKKMRKRVPVFDRLSHPRPKGLSGNKF